MNFGLAIEAMKAGQSVRRAGWNGKGMSVWLWKADMEPCRFQPCFVMFTAKGLEQPGWLASQADMLAEDWEIVF